jgi:hypothetical protein
MTSPQLPAPAVTRRGAGADRDAAPCDATQIGDPVEVVLHDTGQGAARPRSRPAGR